MKTTEALDYNQPEKRLARERLLEHAVRVLTVSRHRSYIIQEDDIESLAQHCSQILRVAAAPASWLTGIREELAQFIDIRKHSVDTRRADQLRVLYLCGPQPANDLRTLLKLGCAPSNIWAVESDPDAYATAVAELASIGQPLRIHRGGLRSFFELVHERFDLVYIDGCAPLCGGKPNSVTIPLAMFAEQRLSDLSVVITTYAQVPSEKSRDYGDLMSCFFAPRYNDVPACLWEDKYDPAIGQYDLSYAREHVMRNIDAVYSEFVTRFIVDLARSIVPLARVGANSDVRRLLLKGDESVKAFIAQATSKNISAASLEEFLRSKHVLMTPDALPLMCLLYWLSESEGAARLLKPLLEYKIGPLTVEDALPVFTLLQHGVAGYLDIGSPEMLRAIRAVWFDSSHAWFCDVSFPHLILNLVLGMYSQPQFANATACLRLQYRAKKTTMYSDLLVFDRVRCLFDVIPTVDLVPVRMQSVGFQVVVRACLDRIGWHDHGSASHPFGGAALAGMYDLEASRQLSYPAREILTA